MALIGTAVAFVIGFQNNAAYQRIWEARKIWGGIVNASRTFGMLIQDFLTNEHADPRLDEAEREGKLSPATKQMWNGIIALLNGIQLWKSI